MPPKKRNGENNVQAVLRSSRQRRLEGRNAFEPHNAMYAPLQGDRKLVWSLVKPYAEKMLEEEKSFLFEKITADKETLHFTLGPKLDDAQFQLGLVEFVMDSTDRYNLMQAHDPGHEEMTNLYEVALKNKFDAKEEFDAHREEIIEDIGRLAQNEKFENHLKMVTKHLIQ